MMGMTKSPRAIHDEIGYLEILHRATLTLRAAGVEFPRREARRLLAHVLRVPYGDIVTGDLPDPAPAELTQFAAVLARRAAREPFAYVTGSREFWSLDFAVAPEVLIPRPESETLVEEALRRFPDRSAHLRVLDLGTGSGCLLLAFLSERPHAQGWGIDISERALAMAAQNARTLGLEARARFVRGDWMEPVAGAFDAIFANPPYVAHGALEGLEPEVAHHEPRTALDGGGDGLAAYRRIAAGLARHLSPEGRAFFELGQGQAEAVGAILLQNGLALEGTVCDLAGIPRCLVAGSGTGRDRIKKTIGIGDTKRLGSAPLGKAKGFRPPLDGRAGGSAS